MREIFVVVLAVFFLDLCDWGQQQAQALDLTFDLCEGKRKGGMNKIINLQL